MRKGIPCYLSRFSINHGMYILSGLTRNQLGHLKLFHVKIVEDPNSKFKIEGTSKTFDTPEEMFFYYENNSLSTTIDTIGKRCTPEKRKKSSAKKIGWKPLSPENIVPNSRLTLEEKLRKDTFGDIITQQKRLGEQQNRVEKNLTNLQEDFKLQIFKQDELAKRYSEQSKINEDVLSSLRQSSIELEQHLEESLTRNIFGNIFSQQQLLGEQQDRVERNLAFLQESFDRRMSQQQDDLAKYYAEQSKMTQQILSKMPHTSFESEQNLEMNDILSTMIKQQELLEEQQERIERSLAEMQQNFQQQEDVQQQIFQQQDELNKYYEEQDTINKQVSGKLAELTMTSGGMTSAGMLCHNIFDCATTGSVSECLILEFV